MISRAVLAMFWFGIQTFTGSECVYQMIKAIWPSFARFPNHLPASANITSAGLRLHSYFVIPASLIQFPIPTRAIILLHILAYPVPVLAGITPPDPLVIPCQSHYRSPDLCGHDDLGVRKDWRRPDVQSTEHSSW